MCPQDEIDELIDENHALINRQLAEEILELIVRPMTLSQIDQAVCARYQLFTRKPPRSLRFERNVRFFVEYLLDEGQLELTCRRGVAYYCRPSAQ